MGLYSSLEGGGIRGSGGATLITSQFPVSAWYETIPDPTVADAILDRLINNAHRIKLKGESMRKRKSKGT